MTFQRRAIWLVLVAPAVLSCDLLRPLYEVSLTVSPPPPAWESAWGPARFSLSWISPGGTGAVEQSVGPGETVVVAVRRLTPLVLRAVPVWDGGGPAFGPGETAPAEAAVVSGTRRVLPGEPIVLRFETGPAAEVLWRLLEARVDLRGFNVDRLLQEIAERLPDDPWLLDTERVVRAIGERAMRAGYVRERERFETGLRAPEGTWYARSPFVAPVPGGAPWPAVPTGVTPFYSATGGRVVVTVDDEGRAWQTP